VRWPVGAAVLDGELYSGDGAEGIDAILATRQQAGSGVAFAAFDPPGAHEKGVRLGQRQTDDGSGGTEGR